MADSLKGVASSAGNAASSAGNSASNAASSAGKSASDAGKSASDAASSAGKSASSGAQSATSGAKSSASKATGSGASPAKGSAAKKSEGAQKWDAMSEGQRKETFDALPEEKKQGKSYYEWVKDGYNNQMENWMPWIEDQYLKWFTSDNKASYAAKDYLGKSKVTGIEQVDTLQDGANNLVAGQVGQGGLLQPIGDAASKEGINRAERGGKDESGSYTSSLTSGASSLGSSAWSGAQSAGGYVSGLMGGGSKKEAETKK